MNIRQLEVFWAVMRTGTVTDAAKMLSISQPAVSRMLRHTEETLRIQLFLRDKGKLVPTKKAVDLFVMADEVFNSIGKLQQAVLDIRESSASRLLVVTNPTIAENLLSIPIYRTVTRFPAANVSFKLVPLTQIINRVAMKQADVGVVFGPVDDPSISRRTLCQVDVVCALNSRHPLAAKSEIAPIDLFGQRIISYQRSTTWGAMTWGALEHAGLHTESVVECNHSLVAFSLVEANVGVAVMAALPGRIQSSQTIVSRPFLPRLQLSLELVLPRSEDQGPVVKVFVECLNEELVRTGLIVPKHDRSTANTLKKMPA